MKLKRKISKTDFETLNSEHKEFYVEKNGDYVLDLESDEGFSNLKKEKKELQDKLAEIQSQLEGEKETKLKKDGDIKALETSYQEKIANLEKQYKGLMDSDKSYISKLIRENKATEIASTLFGENAALALPHILNRLDHEILTVDGRNEHNLRILDKSGKPSALNLDDFQKEILADSSFKSILKATSASGGATKPSPAAGGAQSTQNNGDQNSFLKMNTQEQVAYLEQQKAAG